ncbi:hypothetical protein CMI47_01250 [Candidatus Pacearchaeota archaeon]|nr:hypothetical protein [Candidatus Pacearchaeota archaeon]|tara:strand:- start:9849 stop:11015 length:1167 start_codon:yes stop_codon:yes gene_type:complete
MSERLAIGAVALLAAAGVVRRRGSSNTSLTITNAGWPWPTDYPLYHATTGLQSILGDRFRVRRQGLSHATGGGTDEAVSLTVDPRVADAILVGLVTLRKGARRAMTLEDLWKAFEKECPKGTASLKASEDAEHTMERARMLDRDLLHERKGLGGRLPDGAIPVGEGWMGREHRYYSSWWRPPRTREEVRKVSESRDHAFHNLYNALTASGSQFDECYWASFWMTDMLALSRLDLDDLGFMEVRSGIDRVCLNPMGAVQLDYLPRSVAKQWERYIYDQSIYCHDGLDRTARGGLFTGWGWPTSKMIGPWTLVDEGKSTRQTTMAYLASMFELRVYDSSKITIVQSETASDRLHSIGMNGRVSYPDFSEMRLPAGRISPGALVLQRGGAQ